MKTSHARNDIRAASAERSIATLCQTSGARSTECTCDILIRPATPADTAGLTQMHHRLSPESRFFRFFRPHLPSAGEMAAICGLTPETGAAFVATSSGNPRLVVGLIYYVRGAPPDHQTAEFAVAIDEGFQGRGLGRTLFDFLCHQAAGTGIERLDAYVHPDNRKMRGLLASCRHPVTGTMTAGVLEIGIDLTHDKTGTSSFIEHHPPTTFIPDSDMACLHFTQGSTS